MVISLKSINLIIPCYNEQENIDHLFNKIDLLLNYSKNYKNFDIYVSLIDNGSTDNTRKKIFSNIKKYINFKDKINVLLIDENNGYGNGILKGVINSDADYIAWTHSDLQTDPLDLIKCLSLLKDIKNDLTHKVIIKGNRTNRNITSNTITFLMTLITFLFTLKYLPDANAQPKLFSYSLKKHLLHKAPLNLTLDLHLLLVGSKLGYNLKTINVSFSKRMGSKAKGAGSIKGFFVVSFSVLSYLFKNLISK